MNNINSYFNGERIQCIIGLILSLIFIAVSVYFLAQGKAFLKGFAYAAIPLSSLLIIICTAVIVRTPKDIKRVIAMELSTEQVQQEEIPRMEKVMKSFALIKKVEIGFIVLGIVLMLAFKNNELVRGIALALILEGITLYLFDHIAEARGKIYMEFLMSKIP